MTVSSSPASRSPGGMRRCLDELVGLALPTSCGGCGVPGTAWCGSCEEALGRASVRWPRAVWPDPTPPGCPPVWAGGRYAGPLRGALVAFKDGDRRDLGRRLAPLLAGSLVSVAREDAGVRGALGRGEQVWVVPVPSTSRAVRRRGDVPLNTLVDKAIRLLDVHISSASEERRLAVAGCLRLTRRVADQAGLGSAQRAANLDRAMTVRRRWPPLLGGSVCVLVDDVLTTGATLTEAARALRGAGAEHVAGAAVAAAQRRGGHPNG